jgi:SAM-dependent methyltransferase
MAADGVDAPASRAPAAVDDPDRTWEAYGAEDPYFGVLTDPRYHAAAMTDERRAEFFATGERHVEQVLATIRRHLEPAFAPARALDFGCGVGRLALPLARASGHVTGIDISPSMLREAAENACRYGVDNVTWVPSDATLSRLTGGFDLVHSYLVLQHLRPGHNVDMIRRLLGQVAPDGVAALHVLVARRESRLRALLYRARRDVPLFDPLFRRLRGGTAAARFMQMNPVPLVPVFAALAAGGFGQVHVGFSDHADERVGMFGLFICARRSAGPRW